MGSWRLPIATAGVVLFVILATLNAGGYRYGASDQAFYIPAIQHHLDPALFPRDWPMLAAQDRLNAFTPVAAFLAESTGTPLPRLFLVLYLAGLVTLGIAALGIARALSGSAWTVPALLAALTLRHAVALGAVNTLEGYMHPRTIAFALGAMGAAALLRGWYAAVLLLIVLAALVHPTTAIWFALWLLVAIFVAERRWRPWLSVAAGFAALGGIWALLAGPLAGRLVRMDETWVAALAAKDYLFPDRWPLWAWLNAVLYPAVVSGVYLLRRRRGVVSPRELGLVVGALALATVFLASIPFAVARVAFAVQLQVPRVLWMLDLLAVVYLVWLLSEGGAGNGRRRPAIVAILLVLASAGRGAWVMLVEHPERRVVQVGLPPTDWNSAMAWIAAETPADTLVIADPGHAWKYGSSVRVAALRDVYLEETKDSAFALYSRATAVRFLERVGTAQHFAERSAGEMRTLAAGAGVDVLVTERRLNLPLLFRNGRFSVYSLIPDP